MAASPNTASHRPARPLQSPTTVSTYPQTGVISQNTTKKFKIIVTASPIAVPANLLANRTSGRPGHAAYARVSHHKTDETNPILPSNPPGPVAARCSQWMSNASAHPPQMRVIFASWTKNAKTPSYRHASHSRGPSPPFIPRGGSGPVGRLRPVRDRHRMYPSRREQVSRLAMPIYEYQCRGCGHVFEHLVLSSSAAAKCPACDSVQLDRLISACAISSEISREANLAAAHRKVAAGRQARQRDRHRSLHEHFGDRGNGND